jgi:hypothetical protein
MSREKGDKLEDKIAHDLGINKSTNSGAKWDNADLTNRNLIIECKYKDKPSLSGVGPEIKKLMEQSKKHSKDWIYIQQNQAGTFVVLDYNTFLAMYQSLSSPDA